MARHRAGVASSSAAVDETAMLRNGERREASTSRRCVCYPTRQFFG
jgi:hypothetical protein